MSDSKKYYYLKLKDNFFDREEITVIESMPNGYKYSNILLKMYLKSLKREGKLMVTDYIPYNLKTLSAVLKHDEDTLKTAIELFKEFRLIEVLDNGQIYMNDIQNFVGLSSTEADRKREYRAKIETEILNELPSGQMSDKCPKIVRKKSDKNPPEIDIELDKEKEIDTSSQKLKFTDNQMGLAVLLLDRIVYNKPNYKKPNNLDSWANEIRLMIERDKRTVSEISTVIEWCSKDSFWKTVILSAASLRKSFDKLESKMQQEAAQTKLFDNKQKMNKREQQLDEIGRMFKEYDRRNSQQNNNDVCCKLPQSW